MPISFLCSSCQAKLKVSTSKAGKVGTCPHCQTKIRVPVPREDTAKKQPSQKSQIQPPPFHTPDVTTSNANFSDQVIRGFNGEIKPTKPSFFYVLSMGIVSMVMVLLPILYLAFICFVAYGVYWHTVTNHGMIGAVRGKSWCNSGTTLFCSHSLWNHRNSVYVQTVVCSPCS